MLEWMTWYNQMFLSQYATIVSMRLMLIDLQIKDILWEATKVIVIDVANGDTWLEIVEITQMLWVMLHNSMTGEI